MAPPVECEVHVKLKTVNELDPTAEYVAAAETSYPVPKFPGQKTLVVWCVASEALLESANREALAQLVADQAWQRAYDATMEYGK